MSAYKEEGEGRGVRSEVENMEDSACLTCRKYFQKLGLTENIWENIMGWDLLLIKIQV